MTNEELMNEAIKAYNYSYSPYSNFKVGAALITKAGKIYTGCNIENASYGATICAERVAITKAVSNGDTEIDRIAIACNDEQTIPYPCGICRQVMSEFMKSDSIVVLKNKDHIIEMTVNELLPNHFELENHNA